MAVVAGRRAYSLLRSVRGGPRSGSPEGPALCSAFLRSLNAPAQPAEADDIVKSVFLNQQRKFRGFLYELAKREKIILDPNDSNAVKLYFETMNKIRASIRVPSYTEKIADLLESAAEDAPDVRTFLQYHRNLRREVGIADDLGADKLMFEALNRVEKKIGKWLMKDDASSMSLWKRELDQINQKLGLNDDALEKLEDEAEWAVAKGELQEYWDYALDKMNTFKRRDELDVEVDPKELDYRPYL